MGQPAPLPYNADHENATILYSLLFLAVPCLCAGQMMTTSQYQDYLKRLDAAMQRWQNQVKSVDAGEKNVDYSTGKTIEHARETILGNLKILRGLVAKQRSTDLLSADISIEDLLGDASEPLSVMLFTLPSNQQGLRWQQSLPSVQTEIGDLQLELRKHIDSYADELQAKAEGCSK
jgi:hypothetical protein